jgi:NADPH:quinone reductase-like Zn-dependent oxidoreductase
MLRAVSGHLGAGSREMTEELSALMERHRLHPPIAETFEFERADKGLDALVNLSAPGKIVVRV